MRLLLDSHAFLWFVEDHPRLSARARKAILEEATEVWVSHASLWELTIKQALRRLALPDPPDMMALNARLRLLAIELHHIRATAGLPLHHGDPFDRLLVAQAIEDGLVLVTTDKLVQRYPVAWLW
jgi:PIN domain nuclease of toxin-antitoxin system